MNYPLYLSLYSPKSSIINILFCQPISKEEYKQQQYNDTKNLIILLISRPGYLKSSHNLTPSKETKIDTSNNKIINRSIENGTILHNTCNSPMMKTINISVESMIKNTIQPNITISDLELNHNKCIISSLYRASLIHRTLTCFIDLIFLLLYGSYLY